MSAEAAGGDVQAVASGAAELAVESFEDADHLIAWYERHGFRLAEQAQCMGETYRSMIMSRVLGKRSHQLGSATAAV